MRGVLVFALVGLFLSGLSFGAQEKKTEPESKPMYSFDFDKVRLIMTKDEIQIYKHLPDDEAKKEFFTEFWRLRDPFPETDQNEALMEFQKRIEYANHNFRETPAPGLGWNTDRGRVLLMIGFPDGIYKRKDWDAFYSPVSSYPNEAQYEVWEYLFNAYSMDLVFVDKNNTGKYEIYMPDPHLNSVIERERFFYADSFQHRKWRFSFTANFKKREISLLIPSKNIFWEEAEKKMHSGFSASVSVYRDYKKIKQFTTDLELSGTKEELLKKKKQELKIPVPDLEKGKYMLDIVVKEKSSDTRFRQVLNCKYE